MVWQEIHKALLADSACSAPADADAFRSRLKYLVRTGAIPAPIKVPRPDGGKGIIGAYPDGTLEKLKEIFHAGPKSVRRRETSPKFGIDTAMTVPMTKSEKADVPAGQRYFVLGMWLPHPVATKVEDHIEAGFSLGYQLLLGTRLMAETEAKVRTDVIKLLSDYGTPKKPDWWVSETRWGCMCALLLADQVLANLDKYRKDTKAKTEEIVTHWRFEFEVINGEIHVTAPPTASIAPDPS